MKKLIQSAAASLVFACALLFAQAASAQTTPKNTNGETSGNKTGTPQTGRGTDTERPYYEPKGDKTQSQDTTRKQTNENQSQGNSAGGTSAWPQATGTTGAITPESQTPVTSEPASNDPQGTTAPSKQSDNGGEPRMQKNDASNNAGSKSDKTGGRKGKSNDPR
ncbi:hypothetical protein [Dyadobacter fermentans]|uniref:Low complexity orf n=1 Tax=Dyadobacter fermentans (strain ATCC 700827 / DSM 18053 / CIP 107007 / KCTC 52180 / NS114) TaxID=471854 RepID=C6VSJ0_DYAFD|nr:hypothetical protein [Dyadobacter fermentans]ACT92812.1 low complexity orf [Dyadobacter fermentans DSM 18053]